MLVCNDIVHKDVLYLRMSYNIKIGTGQTMEPVITTQLEASTLTMRISLWQ